MNTINYTGTAYAQRDTSLPTINATASSEIGKQGSIALITVGGESFEVEIDSVTGKYSWTSKVAMPDGDYSVSMAIKDRAGNVGKPNLFTLRIDTTPPEAPELLNLFDDQGAITGSFDAGKTTDDKRPRLTGIAQEGTTVYLRDENGNKIGSAVADKVTGKWVMEPNVDLKDGANNLTLVAEETFAGKLRTGTASSPFTIVIGADSAVIPPNLITINDAIDDAGAVTGKLTSGALTDDTTPTLEGNVSAGSTVTVYYRLAGSNTWIGSATAAVNGTEWSWTPASALPFGEYEFQASIGTFSSSLFKLDIASAADIALKTRIESVYDDFGAWQGHLSSGAITDDATPTFSGRGEANSKLVFRFTQTGQVPNTVVIDVDSSGNWQWTPASNLPAGNWIFDVQPQGQNSWSDSFRLGITDSIGLIPVITHAYDDDGVTQNLARGDTTDDSTPTLKGTGIAGSLVKVEYAQSGGAWKDAGSVIVDANGNWQIDSPALSTSGKYDYRAKAVSQTGESGWSAVFDLNFTYVPDGGVEGFLEQEGAVPAGFTKTFESGLTLKILKYATEVVRGKLTMPGFTNVDTGSAHTGYHVIDGSLTSFTFPKPTNIFSIKAISVISSFLNYYDVNGKLLGTELVGNTTGNTIQDVTIRSPALNIAYFTLTSSDGPDDSGFTLNNVKWGSQINSFFSHIEEAQQSHDEFTDSSQMLDDEKRTDFIDNEKYLNKDEKTDNHPKMDIFKVTGKDEVIDLTLEGNEIEAAEIFDITGSGNNTLKLDINALIHHGEKDLFIEDGKIQLVVKGNEGDTVELRDILPEDSEISEWKHQDGTVTVAGVEYNVYSHGNDAELLVQQGVKTELV
ncbi:Ig-like domain-containing protein [Pantoea sp.]|uniref:Ig-like domain-containing protein n=1 Tax=Pantoea sp. TaxID=69393 RepID=UPI0031E1F741